MNTGISEEEKNEIALNVIGAGDEESQPLKRTRVLFRYLGGNPATQQTNIEVFEDDVDKLYDQGYELVSMTYGDRTLIAILILANVNFVKR